MTDYSKWKVNDLKAELKRRGIAQTGLRLKQQFIDKLVEAEAGGEGGEQAEGAVEAGEQAGEQDPAGKEAQEQPEQPEQPEQQQQQQQPQQPERDEQSTDAPQESKPEEQTIVQEQGTGTQNGEAESRDERPTDEAPRDEAKAEQPVTEEQPDKKADEEQPEEKKTQEQEQPEERESPTNEPRVTDEAPSTEEAEDQRKRKRRSQSPVLSAEAVANKKVKAQDESPRVLLPEDREGLSTEEQLAANDAAPSAPDEEARPRKGAPPKQDARFKGLFAGAERELARPVSPPPDTEMKDAEVEPALHVATAALYIGGFMRPLQPVALRNHLISLASAPGTSPKAEVILDYHLDSIKTHCFARFATVSAASRVRAALHDSVWPNERNRKALFADFIPETKVQPWIDIEEDSRHRSGPAPRWEVRYDRTDDGVEAILDEIDPRSATAHPQPPPQSHQDSFQQDGFRAPPSGPRADRERRPPPPAPIPTEARPSRPGQGFKPLDELFKSTTAKPKLYYLPVSREMADRRLDRFDDLLQKGSFPRRGGDETRRITFEDGDYFVDNGPEYAGGAGGAGRGRRRGRGRGRGGFGGDSWRG